MRAVRGVPAALALVAVLLSACSASAGSDSGSPAWKTGYQAGVSARHHYWHRRHRIKEDMSVYCIVNAYDKLQDISNSVAVQWSEGFDLGCARSSLLASGLTAAG
jgi:hypothetical protein